MNFLKKIGFSFFVGSLQMLARLPESTRLCLADFISWILRRVLKYRLKVVRKNLRQSFPDFTEAKWRATEKQFYRNLADVMMETISLLKMSPEILKNSIHITNPEIIEALYNQQKSVFITSGHTGNWELMASFLSLSLPHQTTAIYKKLSNDNFDALMKKIRLAHGKLNLIESKAAYRYLASSKDIPHAVLILGDQTPQNRETNYWTDFLHQDTAFFTGLEKMAKSLDFAVVYLDFYRISRGKYVANAIPLCTDCKNQSPHFITEQYARLLERSIRERPDNWLWSHRRWKHKRPSNLA